jgi:hypothetical protein
MIPKITYKEKRFVFAHSSGVSHPILSDPIASDEAIHHGRNVWWSKPLSSQDRRQKQPEEETRVPLRACPQ